MRKDREAVMQQHVVSGCAMGRLALIVVGLLILAPSGPALGFELQSPVVSPGGEIPVKYTCDGADVSPPLRWTDPPAGTRGFALITDDPDAPAGTWVHWVLYAIPAAVREFPEAVRPQDTIAGIGRQGINDFRKVGYGGPCPPPGPAHRYFFKLYALDSELTLAPRRDKAALLKAMDGHVRGQAELVGRYQRR